MEKILDATVPEANEKMNSHFSWRFIAKFFRLTILIIFLSIFYFITPFNVEKPKPGTSTNRKILVEYFNDILSFEFNSSTKVYEVDGRPIIWQFWNSNLVPLYARLHFNAMQCRNPEFQSILVHDSSIYRFLPDFFLEESIFRKLTPRQKSELFRVAVLLKFGGVWVDVDVAPLDKIYQLYELLVHYDIITPSWGDKLITPSLIGPARSGLKIFHEWQKMQKEEIKKLINGIRPNDTDKVITGQLMNTSQLETEIRRNQTNYRKYNGLKSIGQLFGQGISDFGAVSYYLVSSKFMPMRWSPALIFHHRFIRNRFENATRIDEILLSEPSLYSVFLTCPMFSCNEQFAMKLIEDENFPTPTSHLNATELFELLLEFDAYPCSEELHEESTENFLLAPWWSDAK